MKLSLSAAAVALPLLATAQTFSSCNPTQQSCPPNDGLGGTAFFDLETAPSEFTMTPPTTFGPDGATFTINRSGEGPTMKSKFYIMYGNVELVLRTARGKGVVTSAHLQSDVLDEIDWEWLGGDNGRVQSNYFRLGNTESYDRAAYHPNPGHQDGFHTYTIDWTSDRIQWSIDNTVVRELTPASSRGQYPQTPMNLHIGPWSGGDPEQNAEGTVEWAGGPIDWSTAPFVMNLRSIRVTDYSTGDQYRYNDNSGTVGSISAIGGQINGGGSPGGSPAPPEVKPPAPSSPRPPSSPAPPPPLRTSTPPPETSSTDPTTTSGGPSETDTTDSETTGTRPPTTIETSASPTGTDDGGADPTSPPPEEQTTAPNAGVTLKSFGIHSSLFALCGVIGGLVLF